MPVHLLTRGTDLESGIHVKYILRYTAFYSILRDGNKHRVAPDASVQKFGRVDIWFDEGFNFSYLTGDVIRVHPDYGPV